jgi:hypothetical protein
MRYILRVINCADPKHAEYAVNGASDCLMHEPCRHDVT